MHRRADGTFVFAWPTGKTPIPLISLQDIGYFARYSFDHRAEVSGKDLAVASDIVSQEDAVRAFTKVTGNKAIAVEKTVDEWFELLVHTDRPLVYGTQGGMTWADNFIPFFSVFRDGYIKRDINWIRSIHPGIQSIEQWMRDNNYSATEYQANFTKSREDAQFKVGPNFELIAKTLA